MPSSDINYFTFTGRLTKDPELKTTQSGKMLLLFSLAVNYYYKQSDGTYKNAVSFIPITMWGDRGERLVDMLKKGMLVVVAGRVDVRPYQDKNGTDKIGYHFAANQIIISFPKKKENEVIEGEAEPHEPW